MVFRLLLRLAFHGALLVCDCERRGWSRCLVLWLLAAASSSSSSTPRDLFPCPTPSPPTHPPSLPALTGSATARFCPARPPPACLPACPSVHPQDALQHQLNGLQESADSFKAQLEAAIKANKFDAAIPLKAKLDAARADTADVLAELDALDDDDAGGGGGNDGIDEEEEEDRHYGGAVGGPIGGGHAEMGDASNEQQQQGVEEEEAEEEEEAAAAAATVSERWRRVLRVGGRCGAGVGAGGRCCAGAGSASCLRRIIRLWLLHSLRDCLGLPGLVWSGPVVVMLAFWPVLASVWRWRRRLGQTVADPAMKEKLQSMLKLALVNRDFRASCHRGR